MHACGDRRSASPAACHQSITASQHHCITASQRGHHRPSINPSFSPSSFFTPPPSSPSPSSHAPQTSGFHWEDFLQDDYKHPNDKGFHMMADMAVRLIQRVIMDMHFR